MFKLIRDHLKGFALFCSIMAPLCMLLEVFMDLQQPTLMSNIIDIGIANGNLQYVLQTGGRMIVYALLGLLGGMGCSVLAINAATRMSGSIRHNIFSKIFTLSSAEVDELEIPSLVTRTTSDVLQVQDMMTILLRAMCRGPMLFVGGIIMSFILSPKLALILCVILPFLVVVAVLIIRRVIPMYTAVQQGMDQVNTVTRENLVGIRVVKSFTLEEREASEFAKANAFYTSNSIRAQSATFLLMPIVTLLMNISVVAVLWFGGHMEMAGTLPLGRIMAFVNYFLQITNALLMLVNFSTNISRSQASAIRIQEVLGATSSIVSKLPPEHPVNNDITFEDVSFSYGGDMVLKHIDLDISTGQKVGIIGATGCGKSTLASLITRMYDVNEGFVKIGGVDIKHIPFQILRQKVGIVMQNSLLFSGTVESNMRFGNQNADDKTIWQALDGAQAGEFVRKMSEGIGGTVAQRGKNFSGGQKQRLSIARSLMQKTNILILDDATSAVDLLTEAKIQEEIRRFDEEMTLITITQRVSSIMDCDKIFVMDQGEIVSRGNHKQLLKGSEIYRSIVLSQLGEEALANVGT